MTEQWGHDALAEDLAQYLRSGTRMVWTDMQLGPSGSPRPDVYTLERSYSKPLPTAFECKISRSDLRSDTTSGKWQRYLQFAGAVVFAVPEGLCTVADIPPSCGLIVRKAQVWRYVRKATRTAVMLPMDATMKLLIDGVSRTVSARPIPPRVVDLWQEHEAVRQKFGAAVAKAASDLAKAQNEASYLKASNEARYKEIQLEVQAFRERKIVEARANAAEFEQAKRELIEWLGLGDDASSYAVRRRINELMTSCKADERVSLMEAASSQALRAAQNTSATIEKALQVKTLPPVTIGEEVAA